MALQTIEQWETWLTNANIPEEQCKDYAKKMVDNRLDENCLSELNSEILKSLQIINIGDSMRICKAAKAAQTAQSTSSLFTSSRQDVKLPKMSIQMTAPQFRKFEYDWKVLKQQKHIPEANIPGQLYNCCDEALQYHIVHSMPQYFEMNEKDILKALKEAVTKHSNPTVHRMKFQNIAQEEGQSSDDFLGKLRIAAVDCEFECSKCKSDESHVRIRDQFIQGLLNVTLQTDILAKANALKTLEDVANHARAFETALRDQNTIQSHSVNNNDSVLAA